MSFMEDLNQEISIEDLYKVDIRVGTIKEATAVNGSEKLIKLIVDFGDFGERQILTAMLPYYSPEQMQGMQTTFVVNLPTRKMMGLESQGMIFALDSEKPVFLVPGSEVENGSKAV